MKKNVSGQTVGCQMTTAADGTDFTGAVTVYVTGNAGTQAVGSVGSGACVHEGNGFHTYAPAQAETNYDHVAFTFKGSGAITHTVQVYPSFPQTGDNFALIGATGSGLTSLASAANLSTVAGYLDTEVASILSAVDTEIASLISTIGTAGAGLTAIPWGATWYGATAAGVWNAATASYGTAGSYGLLVETNLDAAVSSVSGGGGTSDWTSDEKTAIRSILGVPASGTTPDDPTTGIMDTIRDAAVAIKTKTDFLPSAAAGAAGGVFIAGSNAATTVDFTGTISTVTNLTNLPSITAGWITAAGIAASALNGKGDWNIGKTGYSLTQTFPSNFSSLSITAGGLVDPIVASVAGAVWNAATASYGSGGSYGALIETNLDAAVSTAGGGSLTAADIADAVWDEAIAGHLTGGTTGASLNGAGSAGDPWTATLGGYGAGSAGQIVYDNLDATVSSRASQTSVNTIDDFLDTEIAAIKAKTDNLPADPADASDIAASFTALSAKVDTVDDLLDTEMPALTTAVAAVKAKTDNLPSDPADASDIASSFSTVNTKLDTIDDFLDTEIAAIKTQTDAMPTAAGIADAVWDEALSGHAIVGSTGEALDNAGSGGGGVADWTADEKDVIRAVLGIPASGTTPDDPTTGILDTIRDTADAIKAKTDALPTDPADASVIAAAFAVTDGKIDTVDNLIDTEIAAIKTETAAILVDTTDIQTRLPAALVGGRMDSNLSAISNSTATMAAFNRAVKGNVIGTVGVGSTTTSIVTSSVTPAGSVADKFKGRLLIFADDTTTANLRGQATEITANTSAAAPTLTVTALTTAPASGDTFVVV